MPDDTTPDTDRGTSHAGVRHSSPVGPGRRATRSMAGDITPPDRHTRASPGHGDTAVGGTVPGQGADGPGGTSLVAAQLDHRPASAVGRPRRGGAGIALAVTSGGKPRPPRPAGVNIPAPTTTTAQGPLCPLTGLPPRAAPVPQRPALAVKVDNYPARPAPVRAQRGRHRLRGAGRGRHHAARGGVPVPEPAARSGPSAPPAPSTCRSSTS